MTMLDQEMSSQPSTSTPAHHWRTIRPWSPHFLLTVREITSVSATFVLSSSLSTTVQPDTSFSASAITALVHPGLNSDDEEEEDESTIQASSVARNPVSEALSRGLAVNVNGATWKRVLMRMDDAGDEAILVLYGLMPGRQYDIELGVVSGDGEEVIHSRMVTQPQQEASQSSDVDNAISRESSQSSVLVANAPNVPQPTPVPLTQDEYAAQLHNELTLLNLERENLTNSLKTARRDAQKADAALRVELEALKRASEKHAALETRGRQKILALQEATKQAHAAAKDAEKLVAEYQAGFPAVRKTESEAQRSHAHASNDAQRARVEKEDALRVDRKRTADIHTDLAAISSRLEKLTIKRDKLSVEALPNFENQLASLIREVELVERDANAFEVIDNGPVGFDLGTRAFGLGSNGRNSVQGPIGQQRVPFMMALKSPPSSSSVSNLSSRAPPFDPGLMFRMGHPSNMIRPSLPATRTTNPVFAPHGHTQSLDIGVVGNSLAINPGATRRPVSPVRQTSLPVRMPSYQIQGPLG